MNNFFEYLPQRRKDAEKKENKRKRFLLFLCFLFLFFSASLREHQNYHQFHQCAIPIAMGFFDPYSSFYHTPRNPREPGRLLEKLNARYEILIAPNRAMIEGKRVLDLASHDGRWSFAALKSGATSVIGIEPREQLVGYAHDNLHRYGVAPDSYRFVVGDVFDVLKVQQFEIDTLFCFGFLYHTTRHVELMTLIDCVKPKHIILDSTICKHDGCVVELRTENVIGMGNAFRDAATMNDSQLIGFPSKDALRLYFTHFGYAIEQVVEYTQREFQRVAMVAIHI